MDPDAFRLSLNALVQDLRNVTFLLQKQKGRVIRGPFRDHHSVRDHDHAGASSTRHNQPGMSATGARLPGSLGACRSQVVNLPVPGTNLPHHSALASLQRNPTTPPRLAVATVWRIMSNRIFSVTSKAMS
jgi:hypothetical protein